jgi:hypothetical protein
MSRIARTLSSVATAANLHRHHRFRIPRSQRIHIRQRHIAGAVCSEGGFVFAADDGEGVEDVFGGVPRQAVEVEVERVEAGAEVATFLFVPDEGLACDRARTRSPYD